MAILNTLPVVLASERRRQVSTSFQKRALLGQGRSSLLMRPRVPHFCSWIFGRERLPGPLSHGSCVRSVCRDIIPSAGRICDCSFSFIPHLRLSCTISLQLSLLQQQEETNHPLQTSTLSQKQQPPTQSNQNEIHHHRTPRPERPPRHSSTRGRTNQTATHQTASRIHGPLKRLRRTHGYCLLDRRPLPHRHRRALPPLHGNVLLAQRRGGV